MNAPQPNGTNHTEAWAALWRLLLTPHPSVFGPDSNRASLIVEIASPAPAETTEPVAVHEAAD